MSTICVKLLKQLFAVCMSVRRTKTLVIQFALDREVGFKLSNKSYFIGGMYETVIGYSRKQIHYFKKSRATCMFGDYNPHELLLFFIFFIHPHVFSTWEEDDIGCFSVVCKHGQREMIK